MLLKRTWPGLDGLRGCAVLAVIAYHAGLLTSGYIGVDIFFVLSGFLITRLVCGEWHRQGLVKLRRFYLRRTRRLYPALLGAVAFCLMVSLATRREIHQTLHDSVAALTYTSNMAHLHGLLDHTWTLALEEQFYVIWPALLVYALGRGSRKGFGPAIVVVAGILVFDLVTGRSGIVHTYVRAMGLPLGCTLALVDRRHLERLSRGGLAAGVALALIALLPTPLSLTTGWPVSAAAVLTMPVVAMLVTRSVRLCEAPPLRYFGLRSYSLYLWHFPLINLVSYHAPPGLGVVARTVISLIATLVAGELSYRLIETPFLRIRRQSVLLETGVPTAEHVGSMASGQPVARKDRRDASVEKSRQDCPAGHTRH